MAKTKNKKSVKVKHPDYRADPASGSDWELRHHAAAKLARENPGHYFAVYTTTVNGAYTAVSRFKAGKVRPLAYDGGGFDMVHGRVKGQPKLREVCIRYTEPTDDGSPEIDSLA